MSVKTSKLRALVVVAALIGAVMTPGAALGSEAPTTNASASWLTKDPVRVAKAADAAGYIIVPAADAFPYEGGTMYPTGPISADTLVVIQNPDGSLPDGLSVPAIEAAVAAKRQGGDPAAAAAAVAAAKPQGVSPALTAAVGWYPGANGGWSRAFTVGSLIGWDKTARAGYSYSTYIYTDASGNGLGYEYKCVSSTYCGQVSAYYWVGFADYRTGYISGGSVPWGNVAANRMFMGRCVSVYTCGGRVS
ncbi:MAG: hypothetical protein BGN97_15895 [Microbacterium sp. 69-10]|uniref:hypothetical protein n=1 Tax=Microbacterium sp. 69-10 TaxID=1895783 RepID=UPI000969AF11|nr:hypothetical protein [Microbacterium sp. 69-10]OJU41224.1 MAG: hypothetical protein BGN97_15895 [Microbacterium sp. 69-10]